jgi:hypothetical protein
MQNATNTIVLIAAVIALITTLFPLAKWLWRTYGVRNFDAKKAHYDELIEQAKWYEDRLVRLDTLRKQLLYAKMYEQPLDRFKLAEMISKLDRNDAEWPGKYRTRRFSPKPVNRSRENVSEMLNSAVNGRKMLPARSYFGSAG